MLDIGWSELFVIGIVALIVVGPKDLPVMFRTLGRFTAKARSMSREFQRAMDKAADEAGVKDVARDINSMTSTKGLGIGAMQNAASRFEKWDPLKPVTAAITKPAVASADPVALAEAKVLGPATAALKAKLDEDRLAARTKAATRAGAVAEPIGLVAKPARRKPVTAVAEPAAAKPAPRKRAAKVAAAEPVVDPVAAPKPRARAKRADT